MALEMDSLGCVTLSELVREFENRNGFLRCFHLNVQSIGNKTVELECLFERMNYCFDIIMFTETWQTNDLDVFQIPNMKTFFVRRLTRRGGGACLLIKSSFKAVLLEDFSCVTTDYEAVCVLFNNVVIVCCYRPPDGNIRAFLLFMDNLLAFVNENQYNVVIGGDCNIDMNCDNARKFEFENFLSCHNCVNTVNVPTRATMLSQTIIDLFITNYNASLVQTRVLSYPISDHRPICCCIMTKSPKVHTDIASGFQCVSQKALDAFYSDINNVRWDHVYHLTDANAAYDAFLSCFTAVYKKHFFHKRSEGKKGCRKPWMTRELLRKIDKKDRLFKKFMRTRNETDLVAFKQFRNALDKEVKKTREMYYFNLFSSCSKQTDVLWNRLNSLIGRNKGKESVTEISHAGETITGDRMVNVFNDYFVYRDFDTGPRAFYTSIDPDNVKTLFLEATVEHEVRAVFLGLKNSRSCDADGLQIRPVKYVIDKISSVLTYIFNLCISTGVFPSKMQVARVVALYKKGDKTDVSNYRPVSILPIFSKGLEKIIYKRLYSFCSRYVLTKCQYGFLKHRSTELALLDQKEFILEKFDEKHFVLGIFVDFTQAFDYINHEILFHKLSHYGIRGLPLMLLKSYLSERCQFVSMNETVSDRKKIISGVPQGSILGPLIFNLYINDIVYTSSDVKFVIYADDTSIFISSPSDDYLFHKANLVLEELSTSAANNQLKINTKKTKAVVFHSIGKQVSTKDNLVYRGSQIELVESIKVLGVYFSKSLQWDDHVNAVLQKLGAITGIVSRNRYLIPKQVKLLIYNALFASYLNYCHLVWGTTTESSLLRLLLMQKRFLRIIANVPTVHPSEELFRRFKIIKTQDIYVYRLLREYRIHCDHQDSLFMGIVKLCPKEAPYNIRKTETWNVPHCRTSYGRQMARNKLPRLLNDYMNKQIDIRDVKLSDLYDLFLT